MLLSAVTLAALTAPVADPLCPDPARYYFMLFAGQGVPFRHRTAHTWATISRPTTMLAILQKAVTDVN